MRLVRPKSYAVALYLQIVILAGMATSESGPNANLNETVTYAVTFPNTEANTVALHGLAEELGWQIARVPPTANEQSHPPGPRRLFPTHFSDISREMWGVDSYGITAVNFLNRVRDTFHDRRYDILVSPPDSIGFAKLAWQLSEARNDSVRVTVLYPDRPDLQKNAIIRIAQDTLWPKSGWPFECIDVELRRPHRDFAPLAHQSWTIKGGAFTDERLAKFAHARGIDKHTSAGAIGKVFDVMNIAAGLVDAETIHNKPQPDTHFVDYAKLRTALNTSGLTNNVKAQIMQAIQANLQQQVVRNREKPTPRRNISVEGKGGWAQINAHHILSFEKIAPVDLINLFGQHPTRESHQQANEFLRAFAESHR